jgi:4-hydroxy-4-methyl-2-oxoglutarate aldolase
MNINPNLDTLASADVATVLSEGRLVLGLIAVAADARATGPAWPCKCRRGDNWGLHDALASAPPGAVLVCDAEGDLSHGYFGDLMATDALSNGIRGLVVDGAIRDSAVLAKLGLPIFCRGFAARPCAKLARYQPTTAVSIAGVDVSREDIVVADVDGVAFMTTSQSDEVIARAHVLQEREREMKAAISSGQRLAEILFGGEGTHDEE